MLVVLLESTIIELAKCGGAIAPPVPPPLCLFVRPFFHGFKLDQICLFKEKTLFLVIASRSEVRKVITCEKNGICCNNERNGISVRNL